jgi:hypothetical protein
MRCASGAPWQQSLQQRSNQAEIDPRKVCLLNPLHQETQRLCTQLLATITRTKLRLHLNSQFDYHREKLADMCEPELKRAALSSATALSVAEVQHVLSFCSGQACL